MEAQINCLPFGEVNGVSQLHRRKVVWFLHLEVSTSFQATILYLTKFGYISVNFYRIFKTKKKKVKKIC